MKVEKVELKVENKEETKLEKSKVVETKTDL